MSFGGFIQANNQVIVIVGPFVDVTDGFTPETGVTLSGADEAELLKHGSSTVVDISGATWAAVTSCDGYYALTLTTSHTDTEGLLMVVVQDDSVCLPVRMTWEVIAQSAYASLITAKDTGYMDVNLKALSEDTTAADNAEAFFDGTGYAGTNNVIPTVTTVTNAVTLANGAHGGSSASLNLGAGATISKADGHALTLTGGTNGHGLLASGAGTGSGIAASGGSTSGSGIYAVGDADGQGILAIGGDSALGLTAGLYLKSNSSGTPVGLYVEDGAIITDDAGTALLVSSTGGNGDGVTITGNGSGGDLVADVTGSITSVTNIVTANVTQVLNSATTATFDSLASQINGIGSGTGAALNFAADVDNASSPIKSVTAVGTQTGTYANTLANDGTNHTLASVGNAIDWVYGFSIGVARSASKIVLRGNMNATGDIIAIYAYNFSTTSWDVRATFNGTTETLYDIALLSAHTGQSGADAGKVYMRCTYSEGDAGTLVIDELYVQAQQSGSLVGYALGAIWVNTTVSNANTVPYVDGTADNPVSTWAAALTLSTALGIKRFKMAAASSITLTGDSTGFELLGDGLWSLALGNQNISNAFILKAALSGVASGSNTIIEDSLINAGTSTGPSYFVRCGFNTTSGSPFTAAAAGQYAFVDCVSTVAGSGTPYFTFAGMGSATGINFRRWSGGSNFTLDGNCTATMEVVTGGGQTMAVGGADAEIRGICRSVTLTGVTTDSTVQIDAVTGPISIAGADGTVNIYGVCGVVTDSRTGTPLGTNSAISRVNINAEVDTAVLDGVNITRVNNLLIDGAGTEGDPWGPAA